MLVDKRLERRWLEALRSGEYKQGYTFLVNKTDNTYCCLGVLCTIAESEGLIQGEDVVAFDTGKLVRQYDGHSHYPVSDFVRSVEAQGNRLKFIALPEMNDRWKFSFAEIADAIENDWTAEEALRRRDARR